MRVEVLGEISMKDLAEVLRDVRLVGRPDIAVYEHARISLKEFHAEEVNPTSFYLLKENLERQRDLRAALLSQGIDTLNLDRVYQIRIDGGVVRTLTPPMVEITPRRVAFIPKQGEIHHTTTHLLQIPIVMDGIHRVQVARENGGRFRGIQISNAHPEFPFYAHPNSWDEIKIFDELPKTTEEKKLYSREKCYDLYRNFEPLGIGAPRGTG